MKNFVILILSLLLFVGCKNEASSPAKKSNIDKKTTSAVVTDFECQNFFKKGNYSSVCFINGPLPEYGGAGCILSFVTKGNKQEQSLVLQFTKKKSKMLAEMHYNLDKNNYKKGEIIEVSNLGDAAFFDRHGTDLKSLSRSNKDLHVHYQNISFVLMAEYLSSTEEPCFFEDDELIGFAKKIIEHL